MEEDNTTMVFHFNYDLKYHYYYKEYIYNNNIKVYFLDRIRDEKKFSSLDELKIQLEKDKKFAKNQSEKIIL